jgi:hypothetical protein
VSVSTWRKIGAVARVAGAQAGRSRTLNAAKRAAGATLRSLTNVLHQLWLEVIGTVFLAMAGFGGFALMHEYAKYQAGQAPLSRVAIAICFTLAFGWFGVSSFWRVHRKSQRS